MKIVGKNGLGDILKNFLQICLYLGVLTLIALPFILKSFGLSLNAAVFFIYPNGIILIMISHKFIELFDSLKMNNPFCENNVKILRRTGVIAFVGSCSGIIDLLYEIILAKSLDIIFILVVTFLGILYFGVSVALYILSELFRQATEYKTENELTI